MLQELDAIKTSPLLSSLPVKWALHDPQVEALSPDVRVIMLPDSAKKENQLCGVAFDQSQNIWRILLPDHWQEDDLDGVPE